MATPPFNDADFNQNFHHKKSQDTREERQIYVPPISKTHLLAQSNLKLNYIRTAKFTAIDFLPKQLYIQFSKPANFFFLIVSIIQLIPGVSSTGKYTTVGPLALFVSIAIVREGVFDRKRHVQDNQENNQIVKRLEVSTASETPYAWNSCCWKDLKVGDKLLILKNEFLPADLLLISSAGEEGECYVETASLDGETNLKKKNSIKAIHEKVKTSNEFGELAFVAKVQIPNNDLHNFEGNVEVLSSNSAEKKPIDYENVLLRGSKLCKTDWVFGVVIYAGEDTKIRKNANQNPPNKVPDVERRITNRALMIIAIIIMLMSLVAYGLFLSFDSSFFSQYPELYGTVADLHISAGTSFLTFFLLFNTMIPLSLYVTLEIVKVFQSYLISSDLQMFKESSNTGCQARTTNINEVSEMLIQELGQISYLFSDKTGTLTENEMILKYITTCGVTVSVEPGLTSVPIDLTAEQFTKSMRGEDGSNEYQRNIVENSKPYQNFVLGLALCHTVIPDRLAEERIKSLEKNMAHSFNMNDGIIPNESEPIEYQASSPDEFAIINACVKLDAILFNKRSNNITLKLFGKMVSFELLQVVEFSSNRKRMTTVYRTPENKIVVYCKGADNVILERLDPNMSKSELELKEQTLKRINNMAVHGHRTLLYAYKEITEKEYNEWKETYEAAKLTLIDRVTEIEKAGDLIEKNLHLIGGTGIEDKLQDKVPETIDLLRKAGIRVWVLTGDKRETVINIAKTSKIIKSDSTIIQFNHPSTENWDEKAFLKSLNECYSQINPASKNVIVIDGYELRILSGSPVLTNKFLVLSNKVDTVICCRVSPVQKAIVVRMVKQKLADLLSAGEWPSDSIERTKKSSNWNWFNKPMTPVTCAIGDGANDVTMIQEAHVGLGITGKEGSQAARCSDFSLPEFKCLQRLILVHGHWSYYRICKFLLNSFYKSAAFYLTNFVFQCFTMFSGTSYYEQWLLALYNVTWTSLPVMFCGVLDKDYSEEKLLECPELYRVGPEGKLYNLRLFGMEMLTSLYHSIAVTLLTIYLSSPDENNVYALGMIALTTQVLAVNFKIAYVSSQHWSWLVHLSILLTLLGWFVVITPIYNTFARYTSIGFEVYGMFFHLFAKSIVYLQFILITFITLLPNMLYESYKKFY